MNVAVWHSKPKTYRQRLGATEVPQSGLACRKVWRLLSWKTVVPLWWGAGPRVGCSAAPSSEVAFNQVVHIPGMLVPMITGQPEEDLLVGDGPEVDPVLADDAGEPL